MSAKVVGKKFVPETVIPERVVPAHEEDIVEWECKPVLPAGKKAARTMAQEITDLGELVPF